MRALLAVLSATSLALAGGAWVAPAWSGGARARAVVPPRSSIETSTGEDDLWPVSAPGGRTWVRPPAGEEDLQEEDEFNDVVGIGGGGAGGSFSFRCCLARRSSRGDECGHGTASRAGADAEGGAPLVVARGAGPPGSWLTSLQSNEGAWPPAWSPFRACTCSGGFVCGYPRYQLAEVGATALALLALLGDGNTTREGPYREAVARGARWLKLHQDPQTGLFTDGLVRATVLEHALATMAFAEAYSYTRSPLLRRTLREALRALLAEPSDDVFTTGWQLLAVRSAEEAGIEVEREGLRQRALALFEATTDPLTGATLESDTLTAMSLLGRLELGRTAADDAALAASARWLAEHPPSWNPARFGCERWKWLLGSMVSRRRGGGTFTGWDRALAVALSSALGRAPEYADVLSREQPPVSGSDSVAVWSLSLQHHFRTGR